MLCGTSHAQCTFTMYCAFDTGSRISTCMPSDFTFLCAKALVVRCRGKSDQSYIHLMNVGRPALAPPMHVSSSPGREGKDRWGANPGVCVAESKKNAVIYCEPTCPKGWYKVGRQTVGWPGPWPIGQTK